MTTTPFLADRENDIPAGISIETTGRGADFYADGSFVAWDGSGMFNRCEATGNLHCYVPVAVVQAAISAAEKFLGVAMEVRAILPGAHEIEGIVPHLNNAGEIYYSTEQDGETIYSFSDDFEDIWKQEDQDTIDAGSTPSKL